MGGWLEYRMRAALLPAMGALVLAGCTVQQPVRGTAVSRDPALAPVTFAAMPGWNAAIAETGLRSFRQSCRAIDVMPVDQVLGGTGVAASRGGKAGSWRGVCAAARAVAPGDAAAAARFFQTRFTPYKTVSTTRITGYFEPIYAGSEVRLRGYDVPLYGKPRTLVRVDARTQGGTSFTNRHGKPRIVGRLRHGKLVPFYSRARIAAGAIERQAPVVAWLRNPVDAYMMQVQGAAQLRLPDGTPIDLEFDGTNGRGYTPIGKLMVAKGDLAADDVSVQTISAWLRAHPRRAMLLMNANRNYVFFKRARAVPDGLGAPGALGVPLSPEASLAVDEKAIPLGTPVFVATPSLDALTVAQDIDVDAHGLAAAQIFIGIGNNAAQIAGAMDAPGRIFVLLPRLAAAKPVTGGTS